MFFLGVLVLFAMYNKIGIDGYAGFGILAGAELAVELSIFAAFLFHKAC